MIGTFDFYRLYRFYKMLQEQGYQLVFGGLNGELHKGDYVKRELPFFYSRKINLSKFYDRFIIRGSYPEAFQGDNIKRYFTDCKQKTIEQMLKRIEEKTKYRVYNQIGYWLVQNSAITVTNSVLRYVPLISPLFERDCVAINYNVNPWKLLGQQYQRNEVSNWRPALARIHTIYGYSCSNRTIDIIVENLLFLLRRVLSKLIHIYQKRTLKNIIEGRIDACFSMGIRTLEYQYAINKCKELNILPVDVDPLNIPLTIADRLTTIGLLFAGKKRNQVSS